MKLIKRLITAIIIIPAGVLTAYVGVILLAINGLQWVFTGTWKEEWFWNIDSFLDTMITEYGNWLNK